MSIRRTRVVKTEVFFMNPIIIDKLIMSDSIEPGRKRIAVIAVTFDRFPGLQKHLGRQILRLLLIPATIIEIPIDPVDIGIIELCESLTVTLDCFLDKLSFVQVFLLSLVGLSNNAYPL